MSESSPYDDVLMDHIKNARNYYVPDGACQSAAGTNPLCGDELTVYLNITNDDITEIAFQCTCCGIAMASASIMTEMTKGKNVPAAKRLLKPFVALLLGRAAQTSPDTTPEQRIIFDTVQKYPARSRCAVLPWATLEGALDKRNETILLP